MASSTTVVIKQDCSDGQQVQVNTTMDRVMDSIARQKQERRDALMKFIEERVDCPPDRDPMSNESLPIFCSQCDRRFEVGERFHRHIGVREEFDSIVLFFQHLECQLQWMRDYLAGEMKYPKRVSQAEIDEFRRQYKMVEDYSPDSKNSVLFYVAPRSAFVKEFVPEDPDEIPTL